MTNKIMEISICMDRDYGRVHITFLRETGQYHFYNIVNHARMAQFVFDMNYKQGVTTRGYYNDEGRRMFIKYKITYDN